MRVKFSNNKYIHYIQQANYARLINRCTYTFRLLQGYIAERRMPNKERRTPNAKHRTPNAERRIRKHCLLGVRFTQVSLWFIKPGSHLRQIPQMPQSTALCLYQKLSETIETFKFRIAPDDKIACNTSQPKVEISCSLVTVDRADFLVYISFFFVWWRSQNDCPVLYLYCSP